MFVAYIVHEILSEKNGSCFQISDANKSNKRLENKILLLKSDTLKDLFTVLTLEWVQY